MLVVFLLTILHTQSTYGADFEYRYDRSNPPVQLFTWHRYEKCNRGDRQSPINIQTHKVIKMKMPPLVFLNYDDQSKLEIYNNGATILVTPKGDNAEHTSMYYGNLNGMYKLAQLHFHWGTAKGFGSEHQVNRNAYDLEVHFVHTQEQGDVRSTSGDFYAVVSVLVSESDDVTEDNVPLLNYITSKLPNYGSTVQINGDYNLGDLLPSNREEFYRYSGSLTTPPCNESVVWTIMKNPIKVHPKIMQRFRQITRNSKGDKYIGNYRNLQNLNSRPIFERVNVLNDVHLSPTCSASTSWHFSWYLAAVIFIMC